jgi:hypothetical protein
MGSQWCNRLSRRKKEKVALKKAMPVKVLWGFALVFLAVALMAVALMLLAPGAWASVLDFITSTNYKSCACIGQ